MTAETYFGYHVGGAFAGRRRSVIRRRRRRRCRRGVFSAEEFLAVQRRSCRSAGEEAAEEALSRRFRILQIRREIFADHVFEFVNHILGAADLLNLRRRGHVEGVAVVAEDEGAQDANVDGESRQEVDVQERAQRRNREC